MEATVLSKQKITANYDHIELTPEEIAAAIHKAKAEKSARLMTIEYNKRLFAPKVYETLNYGQLDKFIRKNHNVVDVTDLAAIEAFKAKKIDPFILDDQNKTAYEQLCQYFSGDEAFEFENEDFSLNKGIMLIGPVGCGKTSLMRMFGQNSFRPFKVIHCREIAADYSADGASVLKTYSKSQIGYAHQNFGKTSIGRCFDDLGTEEITNNFGNKVNVMQDILYRIYDDRAIGDFHVTTNLSGDEIEQAYGTRVRSRCREMFNPITFDPFAADRRK